MGTRLFPRLTDEGLLLFCGVPAGDLDNALDALKAQQELSLMLHSISTSPDDDPGYQLYVALKCCPVARAATFRLFGFGPFNLSLVSSLEGGSIPLSDPLAEELIASSSWGERRGGCFGTMPITALKALGCESLYWC